MTLSSSTVLLQSVKSTEMGIIILLPLLIVWTRTVSALPMVDPGLFVISGVKTCGNGEGFCLLGSDCSLDQDFKDDKSGHCGGLRGAFTPSAHFVCCSDSRISNEVEQGYPNIQITTEDDYISTTELPNTTELPINSSTTDLINTSYSLAENECKECNSAVMFYFDNKPVCFGSHISKGWILTSGSCAASIHFLNELSAVSNITSFFLDQPHTQASVKTIIVHEKYKGPSSFISLPEVNNLALVQLDMSDSMAENCISCISKSGQTFGGKMCNTVLNITESIQGKAMCETELETLEGEAKEEFLTLGCNSPNLQYPGINVGRPLYCDGVLAGIESMTGAGVTVFTQLALYEDWIKKNMQESPEQIFRTST